MVHDIAENNGPKRYITQYCAGQSLAIAGIELHKELR